jgi:hypothetical protein
MSVLLPETNAVGGLGVHTAMTIDTIAFCIAV